MNVKDIRRHNLRELAKQAGGITLLSKFLKKPQSQLSHLIGIRPSKNVGDKIAIQIEQIFNKPPGWLDQWHSMKSINEVREYVEKNISLNSIQWLSVIHWDDMQAFTKHSKSILPEAYYSVPRHFNFGKESFVVKVNKAFLQESLNIHINGEGLLIIDPTGTAHENSFVIALEKRKNKKPIMIKFQKQGQKLSHLGSGNHLPTGVIEHDKIMGVVRQIVLIMEP